jgi:hypothetical protein
MINESPHYHENFIEPILNGKKPIENLIAYWIKGSDLELCFGPDMDMDKPSINEENCSEHILEGSNLIFLQNNKPLNIIDIDIEKTRGAYKKVDSWFPAVMVADTGKYRIPLEEMEAHREKNGVKWLDDAGEYIVNPSFVGNLIASYLGEARAIIRVFLRLLSDRRYGAREYFIIEITSMDEHGGFEKYAVRKDRLLGYTSK